MIFYIWRKNGTVCCYGYKLNSERTECVRTYCYDLLNLHYALPIVCHITNRLLTFIWKKSYIILIVSNICRIFKYYVACEEGYTGQNCEIVCPFPSYGLDCQSICNCAETTCDHVNGCRGYSSGIYCYNFMSQYAVFLVLSMICKGYWTVIEH